MIDWLISGLVLIKTFSLWAIGLYYIPAVLCLVGYGFLLKKKYTEAVRAREKDQYFTSPTIGNVLGWILLSLVPVVNIFALIFDIELFNVPLVKSKDS